MLCSDIVKKPPLTRYSIRILWQRVSGSAKVLMKLNQLSRQKVAQAGIRQMEQVRTGWRRPLHKCEKSQPSEEQGGRTGSNSKRLRTKMKAIRAATTITQVEKNTSSLQFKLLLKLLIETFLIVKKGFSNEDFIWWAVLPSNPLLFRVM